MKTTPNFTPAAREAINRAEQSAALLRADLLSLNTALTTSGNNTTCERLAHDCLLAILDRFAPAETTIRNLATAILEDRS